MDPGQDNEVDVDPESSGGKVGPETEGGDMDGENEEPMSEDGEGKRQEPEK